MLLLKTNNVSYSGLLELLCYLSVRYHLTPHQILRQGIGDKLTRGLEDKGISQNVGRKNLGETWTSRR